jgi:hypothetical protein
MLLTDDATRFRWVYFLNKKSDAIPVLKWWLSWMRNQGFQTPAFFHMDNELVTNAMKDYCLEEGIKLEPSNPDSPWQDGVSERGIRTISGLSRAAMLDSNLPIKFWADCVESTSLIMNEVPTSTPLYNDNIPGISNSIAKPSPYHVPSSAWFGTPPELLHFRKWGSPVTYHLHGSAKPDTKVHPRSRNGFFIGYNGKKIYHIWDPESDKVLTTSDVHFNEHFQDGSIQKWVSAPSPGNTQTSPTQGEDYKNNSIPAARQGRISHMVNPSSIPVAANTTATPEGLATPNLDNIPKLRYEDLQDSNIDLDPDFVWYKPAKNFEVFAFAVKKADDNSLSEPRNYKEALASDKAAEWIAAMECEIAQLMDKRSWNLVLRADLPSTTKILLGRWVYRKKLKDDGSIHYKARWVVRGDLLRGLSEDYETYSPVVDAATTKILFAVAAFHGWTIRQADAVLAFLNGRLPTPVHMIQPTGFEKGEKGTLVCEVVQALYGLTTSPRIWYDTVTAVMKRLGFRTSPYDPGLWISTTRKHLYVSAHVDDFKVVSADPKDADWVILKLMEHFEIKDLGRIKHYLGIDVTMTDDGIKLSQESYIDALLESFGMNQARPHQMPLDQGIVIDDLPDPSINVTEYQRGVGSLQYLSDKTRPDIARAASLLAEWNSKPTPKCWTSLKHVLRYLAGSRNRGIFYKKRTTDDPSDIPMPTCYTDSDWAGRLTDRRRSVGGYVFMLASGPVSWKSKKQTCTATSSNEAEYVAASEAARQATWMRRLLGDMGLYGDSLPPIPLLIDSYGAKSLVTSTMGTTRSKHIDLRYHYTREAAGLGFISISGVSSLENAADGFTKILNSGGFDRFLRLIHMK